MLDALLTVLYPKLLFMQVNWDFSLYSTGYKYYSLFFLTKLMLYLFAISRSCASSYSSTRNFKSGSFLQISRTHTSGNEIEESREKKIMPEVKMNHFGWTFQKFPGLLRFGCFIFPFLCTTLGEQQEAPWGSFLESRCWSPAQLKVAGIQGGNGGTWLSRKESWASERVCAVQTLGSVLT